MVWNVVEMSAQRKQDTKKKEQRRKEKRGEK